MISPEESESNDRFSCPVGKTDCNLITRLEKNQDEIAALKSQVSIDELTGLYNYRYFSESLDNEMERTRRTYQTTCLIMLDLDHFKAVNDNYGHEAGNQVLRITASHIKSNLRKLDYACRYGGEEFAIILPNTRLIKAVEVAERLRERQASEAIVIDEEHSIRVTASLGVGVFSGREFWNRDQFIAYTDRFLYEAKNTGRNRVIADAKSVKPMSEVTYDEKRDLLM
jgi:diguanylate cyclase (GGDEF)-like protein